MTLLQKNLSSLLEERNLSIAQAERLSGLRLSTLRNIIRGRSKNPTLEVLNKLASFFDCTIAELIEGDPAKKDLSLSEYLGNYQLLVDFALFMQEAYQKESFQITLSQFSELQKECCEYAKQNNLEKLDKKFLNWLISKEISSGIQNK